jgi:hypothetical protein
MPPEARLVVFYAAEGGVRLKDWIEATGAQLDPRPTLLAEVGREARANDFRKRTATPDTRTVSVGSGQREGMMRHQTLRLVARDVLGNDRTEKIPGRRPLVMDGTGES